MFSYTAEGEIFVPEIKLSHLSRDDEMIPLRGYGHVQAVKGSNGQIKGWILKEDGEKCKQGLCNPRHS